MLTTRIIPCLDVKDGRVVKGVKFQNLRDAGDPATQAQRYEETGADELVILDVSATPEGRSNAAHTVAAVRAVLGIPLTVGGGIRAIADAERLLAAGADKVSVNTAAVHDPELISRLSERFGAQCTVLGLDALHANPLVTLVIQCVVTRRNHAGRSASREGLRFFASRFSTMNASPGP